LGSWVVVVVAVLIGFGSLTWVSGCNKSESSSGGSGSGNDFFVVLGPPDMNADGTIKDSGLDKVKQAANQSSVVVRMSGHAELSDAGLAQLGQFKNVRRVLAISSKITPAGIEKFKKALPNAEVEK
jgi:hypothetical protein